jgi:hypothetical protein
MRPSGTETVRNRESMSNLAAGARGCGAAWVAIVGIGVERYAQFVRQLSPARGWRAQLESRGLTCCIRLYSLLY